MRKSEMKKYKDKLIEIKREIFSGIQSLHAMNLGKNQRDYSGDLSSAPKHLDDLGTDNYDREFYLNLAEEERERIYTIDKALERVASGGYGVCEVDKKKIDIRRLDAIPYATLCVECQEELEKNAELSR